MSRLSIELTDEQHQRLKAIAALQGKSIKEYVLECSLPDVPGLDVMSEQEALRALETFLKPRLEAAKRGEFSERNALQIFSDVNRDFN